jgi:two-component system, cell cycle sensor histidine kinase and response regulator CckA
MNRTADSTAPTRNPADGHPTTVLVVDDEPTVLDLLVMMLEMQGYKVLSAEDGAQALAISKTLQGDSISVLVTDLCMPGMSGTELAAELRVAQPELKTIFISGLSRDEITAMGVDLSQGAFISKPFQARAFDAAVRELTERQPSRC